MVKSWNVEKSTASAGELNFTLLHRIRRDGNWKTWQTSHTRYTSCKFSTEQVVFHDHVFVIFTAHIRGTAGVYVLQVCLFTGRGYPLASGPRSFPGGGAPSNPVSGPLRSPVPGSGGGAGVIPARSLDRGSPSPQTGSGQGTPLPPRQHAPWTGKAAGGMHLAVSQENFLV